jgi:glutaminyl-tRNA synthetase
MGGKMPDNEKVKGIVHWVSEPHSLPATVRLYDRLFSTAEPGADQPDGDFLRDINPASLTELGGARLEPAAAAYRVGDRVQFERMGYFGLDPDSTDDRPVFNRIVTLRDNWAKATP